MALPASSSAVGEKVALADPAEGCEVIVELNPAKWFAKKPVAMAAAAVAPPVQVSEVRNAAVAVESVMSTAAVVPAVPASKPSGFVRFIDALGGFFQRTAPVLEKVAV